MEFTTIHHYFLCPLREARREGRGREGGRKEEGEDGGWEELIIQTAALFSIKKDYVKHVLVFLRKT